MVGCSRRLFEDILWAWFKTLMFLQIASLDVAVLVGDLRSVSLLGTGITIPFSLPQSSSLNPSPLRLHTPAKGSSQLRSRKVGPVAGGSVWG